MPSLALCTQRMIFCCPRLREQCLQIATRRIKREITDIKFHRHLFLYLFPCGINRSFRSFPICQGLHDPEERSLGFLTGLSCRIQLIWKVPEELKSRVSSTRFNTTLRYWPLYVKHEIYFAGTICVVTASLMRLA